MSDQTRREVVKRATVIAVAVVVAVMAAGFAWAAEKPCPCPEQKAAKPVVRRVAARPSFAVSSAFAQVRPEIKRDTVVIHRDVFHEIARARPGRSWWQRNHRWVVPVAVVGAGVVGYHLRGEGEDRVVVVRERRRGEGDD